MIAALIHTRDDNRAATLAEVERARDDPDSLLWVDVAGATVNELRELQRIFSFHDLAIEDCQESMTKPGVTDYDSHCFVTMHVPVFLDGNREPDIQELNVFLGDGFIVTVHSQPLAVLSRIFEQCGKNGVALGRGADYVFYAIMDDIVDSYFKVLNDFDDDIDGLEDEILTNPSPATLNHVFLIKRQLIHLRRIIGPQREIFGMMNNREFPYIQRQTIVYFRDVYEHLIRVYELIDSLRDLLSGALETYISIQSNRLNEIMKTLAIVSTVLLPMNLVAGIYGMNFDRMPELKWHNGYYLTLCFMACLGLGFTYWFKRRKWF